VWSAERIAHLTGGQIIKSAPDARISGFSIDSRTIEKNECFVAIPGAKVDGHNFITDAFERGASAVLIEREIESNANPSNIIQVPDTLKALQQLAHGHRQQFEIPIVGITGSSGKTTTKELFAHILSSQKRVFRSPGNYNSETGLPLALLKMPEKTEIAIFEIALQHPGDIEKLVDILHPSMGLITHIGPAHAGNFPDIEAIADEKWRLAEGLSPGSQLIINGDSEYLTHRAKALESINISTFGIDSTTLDVRATEIDERNLSGISITVDAKQASFEIKSQLLGRANAYAILGAIAAALALDVPANIIQNAISSFKAVPGRMELIRSNSFGLIINDTYNANPDSMREAILALERLETDLTKILVVGDMLELGDQSETAHREIAELIANTKIRQIFCFGFETEQTYTSLIKNSYWKGVAHHASDQSKLIDQLTSKLINNSECLMLIKGSRGMALEHVVDAIS